MMWMLALCLSAAPAQGADTGVFARGQMFIGADALFAATAAPQALPQSQFVLQRTELAAGAVYDRLLEGVVLLEAIRSAGKDSVFGVDGNSLLPRFKFAYGAFTPSLDAGITRIDAVVRAGLIPELWIDTAEQHYRLRSLAALASERVQLIDTSDLGVSGTITAFSGRIALSAAVQNGEGRREVELNADKDVLVMLATTWPTLELEGTPVLVGAQGMLRHGSRGVAAVRADRAALLAFVSHARFSATLEAMLAQGFLLDANRQVLLLGASLDGSIIANWLALALRVDVWRTDTRIADSDRVAVMLAAFTDFGHAPAPGIERIRLYAGVEAAVVGDRAAIAGVPSASNWWRPFLQLEVTAQTGVVGLPTW